ncbi:MAG: PE family protein [Mycobacterium sp.]
MSTGIAALFSTHAQDYQALATKAAAQGQFVTNLTTSAGAYASAENALTCFLQGLGQGYLALGNAVLTPLERLMENGSPPPSGTLPWWRSLACSSRIPSASSCSTGRVVLVTGHPGLTPGQMT